MLHLTVRMAWHDAGWNGTICKDPAANTYCSGGHSLLSDRLARDKNVDLEIPKQGQKIDQLMPDYLPPCYWTSSAFATQPTTVVHAHPFGQYKLTHRIDEKLKPASSFTWPFRLSMTHSSQARKRNGKYHADGDKRIDRFLQRLTPKGSLAFFYLNYGNPVSADDFKYVLVGCAMVVSTARSGEYKFKAADLTRIRGEDGMENFPTKNWAIQVQCDVAKTGVKLPYQEYLEYVRKHPDDEDKLEEIRVVIDESALLPGFKYVSEQVSEDQCLYLLYKLRRAFDKVAEHGIVKLKDEIERLDAAIEQAWARRGLYPGLGPIVSILGDLATGDPSVDAEAGEAFVSAVRRKVGDKEDVAEHVFKLFAPKAVLPADLGEFKRVVAAARLGLRDHASLAAPLRKLSLFALTKRQFTRVLFPDGEKIHPFGGKKIPPSAIADNPYILCEEYRPSIRDDTERLRDLDNEVRTDGAVDYFTIDIGMFPDAQYLERNDELQDLSATGPQRLRAFAVESLRRYESLGHTFTPLDALVSDAVEHPLFHRERLLLRADTFFTEDHRLHFRQRFHIAEVDGNAFFYLQETKDAEETVERVTTRLMAEKDHAVDCSWVSAHLASEAAILDSLVPKFDITGFKEERTKLIKGALTRRLFLITGRPGAGKTRAIREVLKRIQEAGESVAVLAPTGKATLRMAEEAEWPEVQTIDRWIFRNGLGGFVDDLALLKGMGKSDKYTAVQNIVIDEMSMVDLPHFAVLLRAIEVQQPSVLRRLILVGDENQLPPIGCGRPLQDLITHVRGKPATEDRHLVRLKANCRQRHDGVVLDAAHLFAGKNRYYTDLFAKLLKGGKISDLLKVEYWDSPAQLQNLVKQTVDSVLKAKVESYPDRETGLNLLFDLYENGFAKWDKAAGRFDPAVDRAQILTPYRGGPPGAEGLGDYMRRTYRHKSWPGKLRNFSSFAHSDKVICLRNIYRWNLAEKRKDLLLSNGSIGIVCDNKEGRRAYFPDVPRPVDWAFDEEDFDLAYAITVHKAQGSEFEEVIVVIPERRALLSRELVYTALTRSKGALTILVEKSERQNPLEIARQRSVLLTRNSSLFGRPFDNRRVYEPEPGVRVLSKIEFIIYQALKAAREAGRLAFEYEASLDLQFSGRKVIVHPDFTVVANGNTYYWEHLGMLDLRDYSSKWQERFKAYQAKGLEDLLITTDDLSGLLDQKVNKVINDLVAGKPQGSQQAGFSKHHYLLSS